MSKNGVKIAVIIILLIIIIAGIGYYFTRPATALPKAITIDTSGQPTMGKKDAKIQIVAFEDLKCVNCMRFNTTVLPKIKEKYIDKGVAKYTMINLAFISGSLPAANAARCIYEQNNDAFFDFVDYVYSHQPPEDQNWATIPQLMEFASHIKNIDQQKLSECLVKSPYSNFINNNMVIAGKAMGDTIATPTVYVNGVLVQPLTIERFDEVINAVK